MEFYEVSNSIVSLCLTFTKGYTYSRRTSNDTYEDCWALKLDLIEDRSKITAETITQIQSLKPLVELDCCGLIDVCWVPAIRESKVLGYYKIKTSERWQEKELDFITMDGKTIENIDFYFWLLTRDFWKMNKEVAESLSKTWFNLVSPNREKEEYKSTWKLGLDKIRFFNLIYNSLVLLDKAKDNLHDSLVEEYRHFVFDEIVEEQLLVKEATYDDYEEVTTKPFCNMKIGELVEPLQQLVEQGFKTFDSSELVQIMRDNNSEGCIGGWIYLLKQRLELYDKSKQSGCPVIERITPYVLVNRAEQRVVLASNGVSFVDGGVDKIYFTPNRTNCVFGGVQWEVIPIDVVLEQNPDLELETAQGLITARYSFVPMDCAVGYVVSATDLAEQVAQYALLDKNHDWLEYAVTGNLAYVRNHELRMAEIFDALLGTETKAQDQIKKIIKANHKESLLEMESF